MPEIWISQTNGIIDTLQVDTDSGPYIFNCIADNITECEVMIDAAGDKITSRGQFKISEDLYGVLEENSSIDTRALHPYKRRLGILRGC